MENILEGKDVYSVISPTDSISNFHPFPLTSKSNQVKQAPKLSSLNPHELFLLIFRNKNLLVSQPAD